MLVFGEIAPKNPLIPTVLLPVNMFENTVTNGTPSSVVTILNAPAFRLMFVITFCAER